MRFNGKQIREHSAKYCMAEITQTIRRLGGLNEGAVPRKFFTTGDGQTVQQLALFERGPDYGEGGNIDEESDEPDPKGL